MQALRFDASPGINASSEEPVARIVEITGRAIVEFSGVHLHCVALAGGWAA